jgi:hypothetical protein
MATANKEMEYFMSVQDGRTIPNSHSRALQIFVVEVAAITG